MSNKRQRRIGKNPAGGLRTIRNLVDADQYDWTEKVQMAMEGGWCEPEDLERCIATGHITKVTKDRLGESVGNKVYTILGKDRAGCEFYTAGKIMKGDDGLLYFFITAHPSKRG
jgi:hypothetical protein